MIKKMNKNLCYLCGGKAFTNRPGKVRDNPSLDILECSFCGLVFLSSFSHIPVGFYESSGMHNGKIDIDAWRRDTAWDDKRRFRYLRRTLENKSILDYGCGNGGFLVLAREAASNVAGVEPEEGLGEFFTKDGLKVHRSLDEVEGHHDIITLFHVLEHIPDPVDMLKKLSLRLNPNGIMIIEVPNANDALLTLYRCKPFYEFTYWSCHLFLYSDSTLSILAKKAELEINYIKQIQRYSLANHLYWLSNGKPGGHQKWGAIDSQELAVAYERQLASIGCCDTLIASVCRKQ